MTEPTTRPTMRADVRAFLDYVAAAGSPPVETVGAPAQRALMKQTRMLTDLDTGELAVIRDLAAPGPAGDIPLRLYDARADRLPGPVFVFFHGGGWVLGDIDFYDPVCAELARGLDMPVVSVGYRLAPEDPWPAGPDDCEAAARWIADAPAALGIDVTALVLGGDSAGGNLTVVTAMALREDPAAVPVIAMLPIYPALGRAAEFPSFAAFSQDHFLTLDAMRFFDQAYRPDPTHWRGAPARGRFDGLPPALVLTASLDPLRDEGRALVGWLAAAGVPVIYREAVGNIHGFLNFRRIIPSSVGDLAGCIAAFRPLVAEAAANRTMAQAAGATA